MSEFSDWVPEDGPTPQLVGVYEVDPDGAGPWYSYWDGSWWGYLTEAGPDYAFQVHHLASYKSCEWRGLAEDPNKERK